MRIMQLGVGWVGVVGAGTVAAAPDVTEIVLADIDRGRAARVADTLVAGVGRVVELDAADAPALRDGLRDVDLVVNGLIPEVNLDVMTACLETGTHYVDMAAAGPRDVVGTADVDEELAMDEVFRDRGLTALVFFGIDPGASDVFARTLYDELDTVERLTVYDGDAGDAEGFAFAPGFSPSTMVEECLILPPHSFEDGEIVRRAPLTVWREFTFPDPVGTMKVWNVDHEEPQLMPRFLADKGLRSADFFIALPQEWVDLLLVWRELGFDHNREIEFEGCRFRPLDLLVSRLPKPIDLIGKIHGSVCVGTLAEGTLGGEPVRRFMFQTTSHDEAFERLGVQGTGYQTGIPAACAALMVIRDQAPGSGVFAPEQIEPAPFLDLMARHGAPWGVVDLPAH
jgi:saccharopine dehydrogenase (NAD+, L-lysine-forming)